MNREKGFSLLELLVVLVIISLMTAMILPRMGGTLNTVHLKSAAKKMASLLRYARNTAVSEHLITHVKCDFEGSKILLFVQSEVSDGHALASNVTKGRVDSQKQLDDEEDENPPLQTYGLPKGVRFEKAVTLKGVEKTDGFEVLFYSGGNSSGGEITLINEKGRRYSVNVDFITGTVRVVE